MRIVKNSILLFFRSIIVVVIGLYASRVLLKKLGIEDYGVYHIVGGVVLIFNSFRTMFTNAIQRFLNYERAQGDCERVNRVFVTGMQVQLALSIAFLVLAETLGLYAFLHLNIPEDRFQVALVVYQLTIVTALVSIATLLYDALIISNEKMNVYAWLSIWGSILHLGVVFLIDIGPLSHLVNLAILTLVTTVLIRGMAIVYSVRHFPESKLSNVYDRSLVRDMGQFAGWNFLGYTGLNITHQGVNYILNQYGGVVANAARSIAYQVMKGTNMLVSNVNIAFKPQTNAAAASVDKRQFYHLLGYNAKAAFVSFLLIAVPILIFARQVLDIWLGQEPDYAVDFIFALSGYHLLRSLHELVNQFFVSIGEMREYQMIEICTMVLIIPVAILLQEDDWPFWVVFVCMTGLETVNHGLTVWLAVRKYAFPLRLFIKDVYLPFGEMTGLAVCMIIGALQTGICETCSIAGVILWTIGIEGLFLLGTFLIVFNREDRHRILDILESCIWRIKR